MATVYLFPSAEAQVDFSSLDLTRGRNETAPLSEHGVEQTRQIGRWIGRTLTENPSLIVSSPTWRVYDTISTALSNTPFASLPIKIDNRLHAESPEDTNRSHYDPEVLHRLDTDPTYKLPGEESPAEISSKMYEWLQEARAEHGDEAVIVAAAHKMAIRCLAGRIFQSHVYDIRRFRVGDASANILRIDNTRYPMMDLDVSTQD